MNTVLETDRLRLRPFHIEDASLVSEYMGDKAIAASSAHIPYPYTKEMAVKWIKFQSAECEKGKKAIFAIDLKKEHRLIGAVGLMIDRQHHHAELGYWLGKLFWGKGYCTEACKKVLEFAFKELELHRIHAKSFQSNPISGKVLKKLNMQHEGCMREHFNKWGRFEDVDFYGILRG